MSIKPLVDRLREPSTYAGIAGLLAAFGITLDEDTYQVVCAIVVGFAGLIAMFKGDPGNAQTDDSTAKQDDIKPSA